MAKRRAADSSHGSGHRRAKRPAEQPGERSEQPADQPAASSYEADGKVAKQPKLIVVLERASLETGKVGSDHVLLNSDDHHNFLLKHKREPSEYRPDILHQSMLMLLDSPLNKAGLLKLFVRSEKGVLIEVSPQIRIPRTFKRFCGLMTQLLFKLSIRASNGPHKLLKVIKNPVTDHLPPNCHIVALSYTGRLVSLPKYVPTLPSDNPVVFVAGAMAHGKVEPEYPVDEVVSISEFPLSAAAALARLTTAFENHLGIL